MSEIDIEKQKLWCIVNGETVERYVEPRLLLSDFIRHELHLTGTHVGCEHGVCGACTVLVDGKSMRSCLMLAIQAQGLEIQTVESLGKLKHLHPLQESFKENHALQCGFCTPGFLITAIDMAQSGKTFSAEELKESLSGNLCRCTGYQGILNAVAQYFDQIGILKKS
jgi:aerobic carbon-monoxide dehydrogenase small subunit